MIKFFILLISISLWAVEIDYATLEKIVQSDTSAVKARVILAKHYEKSGNTLKSMRFVEEILKVEPKNKNALAIKSRIETGDKYKTVFREAGLSTPITKVEAQKRLDSYYTANNYQFYSNLYQALMQSGVELDDPYHIKAAYIYLWDARYDASQKALDALKAKNNLDAAKIHADICYYSGKYRCAVRLYEKLYNAAYNKDIAVRLMRSYIYLGEGQKAQRLYTLMHRKYPSNKEISKIGKKIQKNKNSYFLNMQKKYEENKNLETLKKYVSALYGANRNEETLDVLAQYNQNNPSKESLVLEAKYLIWMGKTPEALKILQIDSLSSNLDAKLMLGQIYSWNQNYEEAKIQLIDVINNAKNPRILFDAKNALGHIYMWEEKNTKAKKIFKELQRQQPKNLEVKEALIQLNNDYDGLVKIYKAKVEKSHNAGDIKYLSKLYALKHRPNLAMKCLKDYLKTAPNDLEANKALGLMLIENKEYYKGFGYLEYYAAQKQTAKSSFLLAQNYYWHGFSKEALDVLDSIIEKEKKVKSADISLIEPIEGESDLSKALKLKAKILKISPRFTTSNSGATTSMYYDTLGKKQLYLADTLYFNSHYKSSLMYYENYLHNHPNDHKARYRYAFALENAKKYGKAEGEFSLLFWTKDTDELRYHYAYNMMRNGKLIESKKLLSDLKEKTYMKVTPELQEFLDSWKKSWQSLKYDEYSSFYAQNYTDNTRWAYRKQATFADSNFISVGIYDPVEKKLANGNYRIKFYQEYATNKKSDKGYKTLEVKCADAQTECQIVKEVWHRGKYKKELLLTPYIDKSLKENEYLKLHPLALNSKKKSLLLKQLSTTIYI